MKMDKNNNMALWVGCRGGGGWGSLGIYFLECLFLEIKFVKILFYWIRFSLGPHL